MTANILTALLLGGTPIPFEFAGRGTAEAVSKLIARTAPGLPLEAFDLAVAPDVCVGAGRRTVQGGSLCFRVAGGGGSRVRIAGSSAVELARGVGWYLRSALNMSFSWARTGGHQVTASRVPPAQWPVRVGHMARRANVSYYANVVASSYSHAFWSWQDWERFIDWQALSGVNVALAYTGQEEVWRKTFASFGVNDTQFGNWSNGAAWLGWSRGQSMHGVGKALSRPWMAAQWRLQRRILARMRALGIVPVLPAFQGNVPPVLATELRPDANISVQGSGRHYAAWLDATDPLFQEIGDRYMRHMCSDFKCIDHWYEADGYFTAGRPPWLSSGPGAMAESKAHAAAAYRAINRTDPEAIWLYQGWILPGAAPFTEGLVAAVAPGRLVISDMRCEMKGGCLWGAPRPTPPCSTLADGAQMIITRTTAPSTAPPSSGGHSTILAVSMVCGDRWRRWHRPPSEPCATLRA